jgi:hypothetical protein
MFNVWHILKKRICPVSGYMAARLPSNIELLIGSVHRKPKSSLRRRRRRSSSRTIREWYKSSWRFFPLLKCAVQWVKNAIFSSSCMFFKEVSYHFLLDTLYSYIHYCLYQVTQTHTKHTGENKKVSWLSNRSLLSFGAPGNMSFEFVSHAAAGPFIAAIWPRISLWISGSQPRPFWPTMMRVHMAATTTKFKLWKSKAIFSTAAAAYSTHVNHANAARHDIASSLL